MEQKKIEKEKEYLYWLCQIPGIGAVSMARMWELLGSFERIYNIEGTRLVDMGILPQIGRAHV